MAMSLTGLYLTLPARIKRKASATQAAPHYWSRWRPAWRIQWKARGFRWVNDLRNRSVAAGDCPVQRVHGCLSQSGQRGVQACGELVWPHHCASVDDAASVRPDPDTRPHRPGTKHRVGASPAARGRARLCAVVREPSTHAKTLPSLMCCCVLTCLAIFCLMSAP